MFLLQQDREQKIFPKIYDWFFDRYHRQNNFITKSKCTLTAQNDVTRLMLFVFWRQCGRVVVLSFISILHRFLLPSYLNSAFTITSYYNQNQSRIITVKIKALNFLCYFLEYAKHLEFDWLPFSVRRYKCWNSDNHKGS